jgi:exodeoxyribonuclease VIII
MGLVTEIDTEYHASEPPSKSTLWKMWDKTPWHARFEERKETTAFDFGHAAHTAILEPEKLDDQIFRGPADRRGNKWKEAKDWCDHAQLLLLTEGDYDKVMEIRDLADTIPNMELMRSGETIIETSCYHEDEETGLTVKCRPDLYNVDQKIILDVKNMASASKSAFSRDVAKFGYHVQDAMYSDVFSQGSGLEVDGFFFIAFEKSTPPTVAMYELSPSAVKEGYAIYRHTLKQYAECLENNSWPSYPTEIVEIDLPNWGYKLTEKPDE